VRPVLRMRLTIKRECLTIKAGFCRCRCCRCKFAGGMFWHSRGVQSPQNRFNCSYARSSRIFCCRCGTARSPTTARRDQYPKPFQISFRLNVVDRRLTDGFKIPPAFAGQQSRRFRKGSELGGHPDATWCRSFCGPNFWVAAPRLTVRSRTMFLK
jgi:hypothetical protein